MIPIFKSRPQFSTRKPKPCIVEHSDGQHYLCIPTGIINIAKPGTGFIFGVKHTMRCCHPDGRVIKRIRMSKKERLKERRRNRDRLYITGGVAS